MRIVVQLEIRVAACLPALNDGDLIETVLGKGWDPLLRLYGRLKPFFTRQ